MKMPGLKAEDIMSREVTCLREETTIAEAAQALIDGRISGAPVVDKDGKLTGVISEEDLIGVYYEGHREYAKATIGATSVLGSSLVTRKAITVKPETAVHEIAKRLMSLRIKRVPVVDGAGKVLGVVSRKDILKALVASEKEAPTSKSGRLPKAPVAKAEAAKVEGAKK